MDIFPTQTELSLVMKNYIANNGAHLFPIKFYRMLVRDCIKPPLKLRGKRLT